MDIDILLVCSNQEHNDNHCKYKNHVKLPFKKFFGNSYKYFNWVEHTCFGSLDKKNAIKKYQCKYLEVCTFLGICVNLLIIRTKLLIFLVSIVMFIGISFFLCRKIKQNIFLCDPVYYTSGNYNILISRNFCCYRKKIIIQISVHFHEIFVKTKIRTKSASTIWTANCSYYFKACILPIFVNPSTKLSAD